MLPAYPFPLRGGKNGPQMWDLIRRKYVAATPEEQVRQRLLYWLLSRLNIPAGRIAVERQIDYLGTKRRFDVLVFDTKGAPLMLCECKAGKVPLKPETVLQSTTYNTAVEAPAILLTNGLKNILLDVQDAKQYQGFSKIEKWLTARID